MTDCGSRQGIHGEEDVVKEKRLGKACKVELRPLGQEEIRGEPFPSAPLREKTELVFKRFESYS
jgi:hypothetical protein